MVLIISFGIYMKIIETLFFQHHFFIDICILYLLWYIYSIINFFLIEHSAIINRKTMFALINVHGFDWCTYNLGRYWIFKVNWMAWGHLKTILIMPSKYMEFCYRYYSKRLALFKKLVSVYQRNKHNFSF